MVSDHFFPSGVSVAMQGWDSQQSLSGILRNGALKIISSLTTIRWEPDAKLFSVVLSNQPCVAAVDLRYLYSSGVHCIKSEVTYLLTPGRYVDRSLMPQNKKF